MELDKPINVLHLLGSAESDGSGIATIVAALAQGIDARRFRSHVWFLKSEGPLIGEFRDLGIVTRMVPWKNGLRDPMGAFLFWRQLRREDFDLVHQHWGARSIRRVVRFGSSAKIIVHSHGQIHEDFQGGRVPVAVRGADAIIAVSRANADQLRDHPVHVVYSGVAHLERPNLTKSDDDGTVVIGTACRLIEAKGIRDLIFAFAALHKEQPMIRLEIAGDGPDGESLQKKVVDEGVGDVVKFLGWRNDLREILNTWDIFALPSYDEGLPIAILEAMAEGLPVVATRVGGITELLEDGGTGYLIEPRDINGLIVALRKLVVSSQLRWQFGEAGRGRSRTVFSVEKMVADITSIYESLARK